MLVAKINPPAKKIFQPTPFSQSEISAEYMIAKCSQLVIGATQGGWNNEIKFEVKFGNIKYYQNPDGSNGNPMLDVILSTRVVFTHDELSDWGTDDTVIYEKLATKLGFNIVSTQVMDMQFTF